MTTWQSDDDDNEDRPAKVSVLYRHHGFLSDEDIDEIGRQRQSVHRKRSVAHGVVSRVFRLQESSNGLQGNDAKIALQNGQRQALCLKRVVEEDQVAPHSVHREIAAYKRISEAKTGGHPNVMQLLAAFQDDSDPFSVTIDLVMPWVPCTLQSLLDEPAASVSLIGQIYSEDHVPNADAWEDRPAAPLMTYVQRHGPAVFARQVMLALFSALEFLHETCAIAHRDIKPSNIVVDVQSQGLIRLLDFGTCQFIGDDGRARDPRGDDGRGGVASEVGSGAYRAPECLLSPRNGYDASAVDMWQAGTTLIEFFTPLARVGVSNYSKAGRAADSALEEDHQGFDADTLRSMLDADVHSGGPLEWERALWADDGGEAWSRLQQKDLHETISPVALHAQADFDDRDVDNFERPLDVPVASNDKTASGWRRATLFDGARSDIGLASSIFGLLGLPEADNSDGRGGSSVWPEAADMQPPLAKLPFARQPPAPLGLRGRLETLQRQTCQRQECASMRAVQAADWADELVAVLDACLQLSASRRITAGRALAMLNALPYPP